jgi:lysophospholipase L1-like esterase
MDWIMNSRVSRIVLVVLAGTIAAGLFCSPVVWSDPPEAEKKVDVNKVPVPPAKLPETKPLAFPFKENDTVAIAGSSSTRIGVWCATLEFLLRTRHPELKLNFSRQTSGGGTFATGLKKLPEWLPTVKPNVVLFNYGGNDATPGVKGLPQFKQNIKQCADLVKSVGSKVIVLTPQSADNRMAKPGAPALRKIFSYNMVEFCQQNQIDAVDTHSPLENLQKQMQAENDDFTINIDIIHLTHSSYVAWGYYLYERLTPPAAESVAEISADGKIGALTHCKISNVQADANGVSFTRADEILPILPPNPLPGLDAATAKKFEPKGPKPQIAFIKEHGWELPSRKYVPLEENSKYLLKVTGLSEGSYDIFCEGKPVGRVNSTQLDSGVNLNSVLLDSKNAAPWDALARELWAGKGLSQIGSTQWQFNVRRVK